MRRLILALALAAGCSTKKAAPDQAPPTSAPSAPSTPEQVREQLAKRAVDAIGAGDRAALQALYMTDDEVRGMAACSRDQLAMRDENLAAVIASGPHAAFTFVKWIEKPPVRLEKGKQAAGCTALVDLEIINGDLMFSSKEHGTLLRGMSIVKTAAGWKLSRIDDH
jgi:hypothetical protein